MKDIKINRQIQSVTLQNYLCGLKDVDLNAVFVAGEDPKNNRMEIYITDLPSWIKSGAKFVLDMSVEDLRLMRNYFNSLDLI